MVTDVVVTGDSWIGRGVPAVESVLRRLIRDAENEIQWTIYFASGEAKEIFDLLEAQLVRGVKVVIVLNRLKDQPAAVRNRLSGLVRAYKHFDVHDCAPADKFAKLHFFEFVLNLAFFYFFEIDNVIYHMHQAVDGELYFRHGVLHLLVRLAIMPFASESRITLDNPKRRLHLVRRKRKKVGFEMVRFL